MENYKQEFINFSLNQGVLEFGEFELKSGRMSPYFFNMGLFNSGSTIAKLGDFYAQALVNEEKEFDLLFGPAYKGIPIVTSLASSLSKNHNIDKPFTFNRKEAKDHGVTGRLAGALQPGDKVVITEDTVTRGTSLFEAVEVVRAYGAEPVLITVIVDRGGTCAAMAEAAGIPYIPMLTAPDLGFDFGS